MKKLTAVETYLYNTFGMREECKVPDNVCL